MSASGGTPRRIDVCIVAHLAYGALQGGTSGHIGGVERQTSLMARWLAIRGHRVSLVTWDEGQPDGVDMDGVRVLTVCRKEAGVPGLRFVHPRWSGLHRALERANAQIVYQNGGECVTGQVALWAGLRRRGFVFSAASDYDCTVSLPSLPTRRERLLFRYGLRHADRIIVQTRTQQEALRRGFGLVSTVVPMPCPDTSGGESLPRRQDPGHPPRVLWVGRITREKRPDRFLDLVGACPEIHFDLVGPAAADELSRAIIERARALSNLTVHGPVPRQALSGFYRDALCLCCTSESEGFPNTFLEAWSHGLPVVSTFDPDGLIAARGLGVAARDVGDLARGIERLLGSEEARKRMAANARRHYLENHTPDRVLERFERLFCEVVEGRSSAARRGAPALARSTPDAGRSGGAGRL